jgi:hypothetical protein
MTRYQSAGTTNELATIGRNGGRDVPDRIDAARHNAYQTSSSHALLLQNVEFAKP